VSLFDELRNLEQLHQRGELSRQEFERAKRELLESPPPDTADCGTLTLEEALAQDETQNLAELARIDREWELERRRYEITTHSGRTYMPTMWGSWAQMVVCLAFGAWWTIIGFTYPSGPSFSAALFPWLGIAIIVFSAGLGLYLLTKAEQYQTAEAAYQKRRTAAIERDGTK
jgi:hypothetical protein